MLTILANLFAYGQQKTLDTTLALGSFFPSIYLFVGKMTLTALF